MKVKTNFLHLCNCKLHNPLNNKGLNMKKTIKFVLLIIVLALVSACSFESENSIENQKAEEIFIDSLKREVVIPTKIEKIAVTGDIAQMMIFAIAPEKLVGTAGKWSEEAKVYIPEQYHNLPYLGKLFGTQGELNFESLLIADPDIIIDMGEAKAGITEDLDYLQDKLDIPVIHISTNLKGNAEAFEVLGELLSKEQEAQKLANFCEDIYDSTINILNEVGDEKVKIIYLQGEDGLNVVAKNSYYSELIDLMADNVAEIDFATTSGMGNEVDFEQLLLWNPDYIIFGNNNIFNDVTKHQTWNSLTAIKNKNYYETPLLPYNWTGTPPSVQQYLGMMWYTELFYSSYSDYDFEAKVYEFFKLFYHSSLSEENYNLLLENSIKIS